MGYYASSKFGGFIKNVFVMCGIWPDACSKQHWCHAASSIGGMQQAALVSCSKQHWWHAASSIGVMQQAILVSCSKHHWWHAASSIGGVHLIFKNLNATEQHLACCQKGKRAVKKRTTHLREFATSVARFGY